MTDPIRVLITDDHLIIREGLRMIFDTITDIELVGEANNGQEALEQVEALQPNVVLMDLQMPVMDGITAIKALRASHPELAIIILTTYQEDDLMLRGLQAGARGYLLKDTERQTLLDTIKAAAKGETLLDPDMLSRVLNYQQKGGQTDEDSTLTEREMEVLAGVAEGERNKEIAYRLEITERTVKAHLTHIYQKLDVDSRAAAIAEAARRGYLD
ncbi:MAG: DNA-binding response regulator [Chloroflexi bacterium]|nr:MAG: DNA-binding response regulator [Chloroflexota bacterium]MBL1193024.1 DNA-binding response regulator [Chloroflexota bacterium]NOH10317.1 response regulator transcription factor [Chloroflexota bacterium]